LPISEKTRRALENLELTEYEVRGYTALLEHGAMTASRISEHAEVPYSKVYEILGNLERKGWIETEHGRPSKYYPKSPSEAIATTKMRIEDTFNISQSQALRELQPLYERKETHERPDIWIIRGEYNILTKIRETLTRTKRELLIASPILPELVVANLVPILSHLKEQGVSISIMTSKKVGKDSLKMMAEIADVRVRDQMFGGGVISDSEEVVLLLGEEERTTLAIWADHIGLAKFAKDYFEFLWRESMENTQYLAREENSRLPYDVLQS
jgi:sugar-specific transcriptional regulator TrmB